MDRGMFIWGVPLPLSNNSLLLSSLSSSSFIFLFLLCADGLVSFAMLGVSSGIRILIHMQLREKWFALAHSSVIPLLWGNQGDRDWSTSHTHSQEQGEHRFMPEAQLTFSSFIHPRTKAQGMVLPTFRLCLLTSINKIKTILFAHAHRPTWCTIPYWDSLLSWFYVDNYNIPLQWGRCPCTQKPNEDITCPALSISTLFLWDRVFHWTWN